MLLCFGSSLWISHSSRRAEPSIYRKTNMEAAIPETFSWSQADDGEATEHLSKGLYMLLVDLVWTSFGMAVFLGTWYCMHMKRRDCRQDESNANSDLEHEVNSQPEGMQVKDENWSVEDGLRIVASEMGSLPVEQVIQKIGRSLWEETVEKVASLLQHEAEEFEQNKRRLSAAGAPSVNDQNSRPRNESAQDSEGCNLIAQSESSRMNDVTSDDMSGSDRSEDISGCEARYLLERTSTGDDGMPHPAPTQPQDVAIAGGANGSDSSYDLISFKSLSPDHSSLQTDSTRPSQSVVSSPARSPDFADVSIAVSPGSMIELEFKKEGSTTNLIWK